MANLIDRRNPLGHPEILKIVTPEESRRALYTKNMVLTKGLQAEIVIDTSLDQAVLVDKHFAVTIDGVDLFYLERKYLEPKLVYGDGSVETDTAVLYAAQQIVEGKFPVANVGSFPWKGEFVMSDKPNLIDVAIVTVINPVTDPKWARYYQKWKEYCSWRRGLRNAA